MNPSWSYVTRSSATLPFSNVHTCTTDQDTCLPVGGFPMSSPVFVPLGVTLADYSLTFADHLLDPDLEVGERCARTP